MRFHSAWVCPIDEVIHVDDETLIIDFFCITGLYQTDNTFFPMKLPPEHCLTALLRILIRIELEKPYKILQKIIPQIKLAPTNIIPILGFYQNRHLPTCHQIIQTHQHNTITTHTFHLTFRVDQSPVHCPVLDQVAEFQDVFVLCVKGEKFTVLHALLVVYYDVD